MSDLKEAVIIEEPQQGLAKVEAPKHNLATLVKEQDIPILNMVEALDSFDWRAMKPHQMALLLMQKPFSSRGGTLYLNFRQALLFATRCYELGLSPFSSEVWYDPNKGSVNLSLEGKRQLARLRGIDLGPPQFEEINREWKDALRMTEAGEAAKKAGFTRDVGIKCRIRVGDPALKEQVEYIAYLSEWYVSSSPVWQQKALHMLQTRATEKAISMALGTGASSMPSEEEIGA